MGAIEIDSDARSSLVVNRPGWSLIEPSDVVDAGGRLRPADIGLGVGELDVIAGGPPCQPFSKAAQWAAPKRGIEDVRGTTVGGMLNLVESFLPAAVMMENVAGFLAGANNARGLIESAFEAINAKHGTNYKSYAWVVDAADYGVPQHRRRSILIAFREPYQLEGPPPVTHAGDHRTAWDALGDSEPEDAQPAAGKYADLLPSIPEGSNYQYLTANGGGPELFGYRTKFWSFLLKLARDRPAWTLPASPGPSTGPFHWNNRPLTSSERLLLQGFPADWKLVSNERANIRLAGNATPPPLAEVMGRTIRFVLDSGRMPGADDIRATLATPKSAKAVPSAPPPRPLPERWRGQVGSHSPHPGAGRGPASHVRSES